MISALAWVSRAAVRDVPIYGQPTAEELEEMKKAAAEGADDDEGDEEDGDEKWTSDDEMDETEQISKAKSMAAVIKSSKGKRVNGKAASTAGFGSIDAAMAELDMEHYDSDEAETSGQVVGLFGDSKHPGMAYHSRPEDDPYITQHDDSDSEKDDFVLKGTDRLILAARNEDDVSHLEVWVYEEADDSGEPNLYVHHDIMLPAFPLSLAWIDCSPSDPSSVANLAAVGSLSPGIEVWDLDILDAVEPVLTLGGELPASSAEAREQQADEGSHVKKSKKKSKKRSKKAGLRPGSHEDAVLGLSWNSEFRNVLASASADKTVKAWDLATAQCQHTLTHHKSKVQAVAWNPAEPSVLLSGGFDKGIALADVRVPDSEPLRWDVSADVEALTWAPHAPTTFLASTEDGLVCAYDARSGAGSAPLFRLSAHDAATCAMSFNPALPNLMATASTDMQVKLWDLKGNTPSLVAAQDLKVGAAFTAGFCQDAPWLLAAGGAAGTVAVWDIMTSTAVSSRYGKRLAKLREAAES